MHLEINRRNGDHSLRYIGFYIEKNAPQISKTVGLLHITISHLEHFGYQRDESRLTFCRAKYETRVDTKLRLTIICIAWYSSELFLQKDFGMHLIVFMCRCFQQMLYCSAITHHKTVAYTCRCKLGRRWAPFYCMSSFSYGYFCSYVLLEKIMVTSRSSHIMYAIAMPVYVPSLNLSGPIHNFVNKMEWQFMNACLMNLNLQWKMSGHTNARRDMKIRQYSLRKLI